MAHPAADHVVRKAIVIDFASSRQGEAEASVPHGWNGAWELPMGVVNSMHSRVETNEQNAIIGRHLRLVGTSMTHEAFFHAVCERLLDVHSCCDRSCEKCTLRTQRNLADVFQILASGTQQTEIHLFATWRPNDELRELLAGDGIKIVAHALDRIPARDLEMNRYYHIWDGTEDQGHEFREAIWAPAWMKGKR